MALVTPKKVAVFPASGALGGSTYRHLLTTCGFPGDRLVLINRHPEKVAEPHVKAGVEVHRAVIDAARRAGVRHIFYSSLAFDSHKTGKSRATVMQAHLDTERYLRSLAAADPAFTFTSIREGLYAESYHMYTAFFDPKKPAAEILIPHDGGGPGVAWVKRNELGEATARLIASYAADVEGFRPVNDIVLLTGPREWTLKDTADVLGKLAGQDVSIREVSVDEYARQPQVVGYFGSEDTGKAWADAWEAVKAGETGVVTPTLAELLGRPPEEFEKTLRSR